MPVVGALAELAADLDRVGGIPLVVVVSIDFDEVVAVVFCDLAAAQRGRRCNVEAATLMEFGPVFDPEPGCVRVAM